MATKSGPRNLGRKAATASAAKAAGTRATTAKAGSGKASATKSSDGDLADRGGAVAVLDDDVTAGTEPDESADSSDRAEEPKVAERKPWPVRLYLGEIGYDFIGNRKLWYTISAVVILICLGSMIFRGFNLGVEFAGGERFRSPGSVTQLDAATQAVEDSGAVVTSAQAVGNNQLVIITADLDEAQSGEVATAIADAVGVNEADVTNTTTSASWGRDVTSKALQGLLVFLVLVVAFLVVRFQWKMAVGAMVALFHDLVITAGVYSLVGFEVTPASVIGLLTILGFSLYDTVVVFDKVDENAKGLVASQRRTYSESTNLAINQVLMRSINTSVFALLPVLGLLYAGVFLIGEGTLQDLALVLFVGLLAGVYSSIFLAAPVLCELKEREPEYRKLAKRLSAKRTESPDGKGVAGRTSPTQASAAPAKAARGRKLSAASPGAANPEPAAEDGVGSAGTATLVASARRTRPRSTRTGIGTTGDDAVKAGPTKGGTTAAVTKTAVTKTAAAKTDSDTGSAGAAKAAGSRLAPRPGAKPSRQPRTRGGSGKRT